ncbi:hypothetical protein CEXT_383831 [Caerostris extrusa]|uniref:Secreted protein n=1 Tax=Caerostris extrusa TaxID=172846 RepID=A0AAV4UIZ7_CAEEX|nr:hypothetical protein CEXT_383831 [Caerostris extrusa]
MVWAGFMIVVCLPTPTWQFFVLDRPRCAHWHHDARLKKSDGQLQVRHGEGSSVDMYFRRQKWSSQHVPHHGGQELRQRRRSHRGC